MINHAALSAPVSLLFRLGGTVDALPIGITAEAGIVSIGSFGGLPVWVAADNRQRISTVARRLARAGRIGVLLATDSATDRVYATVTIAPVRPVVISPDESGALLVRRLQHASGSGQPAGLGRAIALAEALDIDNAGRRTFRLLYDLIEAGIGHLPGSIPRVDRHSWLLTQLTRLLFLRFVEGEGWLNNDPHFLATHFDRCLTAGREPLQHFLQPLFFGTLNRPVTDRLRLAREFGAIPFLNGGLFEPHPVERRHPCAPPLTWWQQVFEGLGERIEVTLDHQASGGEVTPEMLGRVFEGVMASDERKASGAFYTPAPLVAALMRSALIPHLARKLGRSEEAIDRELDDPGHVLQHCLGQLRVLDPAVGSGAFLIGALHLLHGPGVRDARRVRRLVSRSLFGIDRHPGAVRITELRLWLEVLRPLRGAPPQRVPPLPNLDAAIRAGDALIDPLHGRPVSDHLRTLATQQRALAGVHGRAKRQLLSQLRESERRVMAEGLVQREAALHHGITEIIELGQRETLFGDSSGLNAEMRTRLKVLRQEWLATRRDARALARDAIAAPFAASVAFGPVIASQGGFDLVIGNPPWVRAERIPATERRALASRYQWWRGAGGRGFQHLPDLAVAFVERSLELLRPGGTFALLVPAKLATSQYATVMREGLTRRSTLHCVADLADDPRATFEATTYPMALIASRSAPPVGHQVTLGIDRKSHRVSQSQWSRGDGWSLNSPDARVIADRCCALHPLLGESVTPQLGVKTGANDLFLNPPDELEQWTRPTIRGRDIAAKGDRAPDQLLWPADEAGNPWKTLPKLVHEYLAPHQKRLERRADQHDGVWWRLFRTTAATGLHRVVWSDLARRLEATTLEQRRIVPLNSCYVVVMRSAREAAALGAWLNSTWVRTIARLHADPAAQGYARFNARAVKTLPCPVGVWRDEWLCDWRPDLPDAQAQLDDRTAALLQLTGNERDLLKTMATNRR